MPGCPLAWICLSSAILSAKGSEPSIPPLPAMAGPALNVRGGPLKTPWGAECLDEDPVVCPILAERGDCFGIQRWQRYNGSLDLSESLIDTKHLYRYISVKKGLYITQNILQAVLPLASIGSLRWTPL